MYAYPVVVICLGLFFFVLSMESESMADWLLKRKRLPARLQRPLESVSSNGIRASALFLIWAFVAVALPAFYEFPTWDESSRGWMLQRTKEKDGKIRFSNPQEVSWYGKFHSPLAIMCSPDVPFGSVREEATYVVEDVKRFRKFNITIGLRGESWLNFLLDINNAQPKVLPYEFYQDSTLVKNNFTCILQQAPMPVEEVPGKAESLCNAWLESQNIRSVRAVLVSVEDYANPERNVWIQQ